MRQLAQNFEGPCYDCSRYCTTENAKVEEENRRSDGITTWSRQASLLFPTTLTFFISYDWLYGAQIREGNNRPERVRRNVFPFHFADGFSGKGPQKNVKLQLNTARAWILDKLI